MKPLVVLLVLSMTAAAPLGAAEEQKEKPQTQTAEATVSYEVLQQGTYSGFKEPLARVIGDTKEWTELWKKHVSLLVPPPPVPEIDFGTSVVAAIFSGEKRTSGYQVLVKSVTLQGDDVLIQYKEVEPPPKSLTMQVITQPFVMLRILRPKGTVRLEKIGS